MQPLVRVLSRVSLAVGGVLLVVGLAYFFVHKYRQMCGLKEHCRLLRNQVEAKQRGNRELNEWQGRLQTDPEFAARIAHENRRVFPNETVFVFDGK